MAGLHPRGVHAAGRASLRPVLGLPGHRILLTDQPLRLPRRPALPHRQAPPGRHRRHHGLGSGALPQGRLGSGTLRRHRPLRARRSAPGRARGLGHLHLQLRPQRGEVLPRLQRAVLDQRVPRRRSARRRRRLDALPGLLPRGGSVGAQQVRRTREPGGHRLPALCQLTPVLAPPRHPHDCRGVDQLPRHHQAGRSRRPGIRVQVEHGLDERLLALHGAQSVPSSVSPRRDDLRHGVPVLGELHPADQP